MAKHLETERKEGEAVEAIARAISLVQAARPNDRGATDRLYAIVITDLEKVGMIYDYITRSNP